MWKWCWWRKLWLLVVVNSLFVRNLNYMMLYQLTLIACHFRALLKIIRLFSLCLSQMPRFACCWSSFYLSIYILRRLPKQTELKHCILLVKTLISSVTSVFPLAILFNKSSPQTLIRPLSSLPYLFDKDFNNYLS